MTHTETSRSTPPSPGADTRQERFKRMLQLLLKSRTGLAGAIILLIVIISALGADVLAPYDPNAQILTDRLIPPLGDEEGPFVHIAGTDHLGRDILSRLIHGSRVSLIVGFTAVAISCTTGCILGLISGYWGGWIDDVITRIGDVQLAFPFVLLVIAVVAVVGGGLVNEIVVIGLTGWVGYARVVRGQVLSRREEEYVLAARCVGVRTPMILLRHILPNVISPVIVLATFSIASTIILESGLTFLGLGVDPSVPTWGGMLADGRSHIFTSWWMTVIPGLAIFFSVLGINLLGDWLRDYLDPELRHVM